MEKETTIIGCHGFIVAIRNPCAKLTLNQLVTNLAKKPY